MVDADVTAFGATEHESADLRQHDAAMSAVPDEVQLPNARARYRLGDGGGLEANQVAEV